MLIAGARHSTRPDVAKAIEQRAVEVTRAYFEGLNYKTKDVGSTESYDIKATKDGQTIKIEVKGTTSDGSDVVLTFNEVELHEGEHPNNAFAIVRHILLDRNGDPPTATGGDLVLEMPWKLDPDRLPRLMPAKCLTILVADNPEVDGHVVCGDRFRSADPTGASSHGHAWH